MKVSAVLKMPKSVKKLMPFAQSVVTAMSDNASFPSPTPALALVTTDIAARETAQPARRMSSRGPPVVALPTSGSTRPTRRRGRTPRPPFG
jgi:hypothetical protein